MWCGEGRGVRPGVARCGRMGEGAQGEARGAGTGVTMCDVTLQVCPAGQDMTALLTGKGLAPPPDPTKHMLT